MRTLWRLLCRMMTMMWKIDVAVEEICEDHVYELTLGDLQTVYQVKLAKKGLYTIKAINAAQTLIHGIPKDSGGWKSKFFFVCTTGWNIGINFNKFDLNTSGMVTKHLTFLNFIQTHFNFCGDNAVGKWVDDSMKGTVVPAEVRTRVNNFLDLPKKLRT